MDAKMLELARTALAASKAAGAAACRVRINASRRVDIGYRKRQPETIKEASSRGLSVDLYVKGRYSSQGTSDLRASAIKSFIEDAVAMTALLAEDPDRTLPDPALYGGRAEADLALVDSAHATLSPGGRHELVKAAEAACLERGGAKTVSVTASLSDTRAEQLMLTSNGFEGQTETTSYQLAVSMTAQDQGDRRPNATEHATVRHLRDLPDPALVGRQAAERCLAMLGGRKLPSETLPVIVENREAYRLLSSLVGVMSAQQVQQRRSFLAEKLGKQVGSGVLTLIDDPHVPKGLGSCLWDDEGMATTRRVMIADGTLKQFYVDTYYGRKLGWKPTTGAPTNLVIPRGKRSVAVIMKDLGRGVLITGFIGGNSNQTTGDQSVGIIGRLFENGQPVQAIAEMNIAGNALTFWGSLAEVADDPWTYGSWRTPSLVFKDVLVAGL